MRSASIYLATLCILLGASPANACDVPVFRYAIDHWEPDPYEAVIFHKGPVNERDAERIAQLSTRGSPANLRVHTVDLTTLTDPDDRLLWDRQSTLDRMPWVVIKSTSPNADGVPVWSGPLASVTASQLVDSPTRSEIARRLLDGQSAVWVLLESGDPERDDAAADLLHRSLDSETRRLTLPVPTDDLSSETAVSDRPEPRIEFSLMRLSRDAPQEQVLVANLLETEWDLALAQAPIAFPVFGRGRVLYALVGPGITEPNIRKACAFLVGACSCTIKDLSPGRDLLMSADWGPLLTNELPSFADIQSAVEQYASDGLASVADPEPDKAFAAAQPLAGSLGRNLLVTLAVVGCGVVLATFFTRAGARKERSRR